MPLPMSPSVITATDAEIIAHLKEYVAGRQKDSPFKMGDAVRILDRSMLPPESAYKDLAVVLGPGAVGGLTTVVTAHNNGLEMVMAVKTEGLAPL